MIEEPDPSSESCCDKTKKNKRLIITIFIVLLAIVCFSLSIYAMSTAVVYFSFMFATTNQLYAKAYLKLNYTWFMATTYMSIFGLVIVVANTAVHFTDFSQKERVLWIHLVFYLSFFICGLVALVGGSDYLNYMLGLATSGCTTLNSFQCSLVIPFVLYRSQVASYFIGYCIAFFAYAGLYHYCSYTEKRQKQEATVSKQQLNNTDNIQETKPKNLSTMSIDESSM